MLFASVVSSVSTVFILSEWIEAPTVFADDCTCVLKVHVHVCVSTCVHAFFFTFLHPLFFFFLLYRAHQGCLVPKEKR